MSLHLLIILTGALATTNVIPETESLTAEPTNDSYNYVSHYRVQIKAPIEVVWPHIVDLNSWMYEFELAPISGEPNTEGQVLRLYEGQEFKIQITKVVPNQLVAIANLPMNFRGEFTTGVGIFTLHETSDGTEVALTMSRRYTWSEEGMNPLRLTRESMAFQERTKAMWQDRFLNRLKELAEADT